MTDYERFLESKRQLQSGGGFAPSWMPDFLFDFQKALVEWSLLQGRSALFEDCGLGKTPQQLVWAENVARKTDKPVLIATPLAVSYQTIREGEKFGIEVQRSVDGTVPKGARIVVTNYERLAHFSPSDFGGMVCDESSILKSFAGVRRQQITEFMRRMEYRLLCTATAAPNDYTELGTSSEALGQLGHMDMLSRFFKNTQNTSNPRMAHYGRNVGGMQPKWRFRGHAEHPFWQWVCSWARAIRRPSDLDFDDDGFILPPLVERVHVVKARTLPEGMLFPLPAVGLHEQRDERRRTIAERCEQAAALVEHGEQSLVWCHLNAEGDLLDDLIPDAEQVAGSDSDDAKESRLMAFARGDLRVLVTKPKIGAWGLNLQNCAHMTFFPSHSYEQYYQGTRRCWRFGQTQPVKVDVIATEGEADVLKNLQHKARSADLMFEALVSHMNDALHIAPDNDYPQTVEVPSWV